MTNFAELLRLIHNLIRLGTIDQVDHEAVRVRVKSGDNVTGWLKWISFRAGTTRDWSPPTVGEQVILFSPGGDLAAGIVLTGLDSDTHPAPSSDPDVWMRVFPDGAVVEYNHVTHAFKLTLPAESTSEVNCPLTTINGSLQVNGDIGCSGNVAAEGNVSDGTRSMAGDREIYNDHTHKENDVAAQTNTTDQQQ
ncbi:MAG: phage baseplate assembly protein V [Pseudohongiella sp.]|nr:phage baseplate assembly protein V [Pseudohongiella sp.]